ncbi:MAG: hypothetical protein OHK0015_38940 [Chloroflexi bacterium OHK40]
MERSAINATRIRRVDMARSFPTRRELSGYYSPKQAGMARGVWAGGRAARTGGLHGRGVAHPGPCDRAARGSRPIARRPGPLPSRKRVRPGQMGVNVGGVRKETPQPREERSAGTNERDTRPGAYRGVWPG